jgi:hypothetical protein
MSSDKMYNSCAAPEKPPTPLEEEDLIHNIYTAGSVVWGRLDGYPWWPAIVDDDPDTEQYYWLNSFSDIPVSDILHSNPSVHMQSLYTSLLSPNAQINIHFFQSGSQFSLIQTPSSRKPIIAFGAYCQLPSVPEPSQMH